MDFAFFILTKIYYTQVCPNIKLSKTTIVEPIIRKPIHHEIECGKCNEQNYNSRFFKMNY